MTLLILTKNQRGNKDFEEVQERIAVIGTKRAQSGLELAGHHRTISRCDLQSSCRLAQMWASMTCDVTMP